MKGIALGTKKYPLSLEISHYYKLMDLWTEMWNHLDLISSWLCHLLVVCSAAGFLIFAFPLCCPDLCLGRLIHGCYQCHSASRWIWPMEDMSKKADGSCCRTQDICSPVSLRAGWLCLAAWFY